MLRGNQNEHIDYRYQILHTGMYSFPAASIYQMIRTAPGAYLVSAVRRVCRYHHDAFVKSTTCFYTVLVGSIGVVYRYRYCKRYSWYLVPALYLPGLCPGTKAMVSSRRREALTSTPDQVWDINYSANSFDFPYHQFLQHGFSRRY